MFDEFLQLSLFYALIIFVITFVITVLMVLPARRVALKIGLVDAPGGRKNHQGDVPLVGGLVVFSVFICVSIVSGYGFEDHWPLYTAIVLLLLIGAVDDYLHLHSLIKFAVQFIAAALIAIPGAAELQDLGDLFNLGLFGLGFMALPFSIVAIVLLINSINLMDGLDGLAGGTSFIILGWFFVSALTGGSPIFSFQILILMAALAGFLFYNMRSPFCSQASIFLGDAGSMCLGLMIAWFAIHLSSPGARMIEPISVAWVMAIPIWDECAQFNRRVGEGRHPFSPDRGHFHHHFIQAGFTPGQSVSIILGIVFLTGFVGSVGINIGIPLAGLTVVWIIGILTHIVLSKDLEKYPVLIAKLSFKQSTE